ncbi:MAG: hypothetical protein RL064_797 [Bacteroidota bacterium]
MCKIKEILRKKGPHFNTVSPNTKILDALTLMQSENYSYVVVMDDEHYLGIMSERDYIHKIKVLGSKQESATVKEILNSNLPVVNFEEDLNRCMVLMNVYKTRYLPVFEEFEFKGVLTMNDLMTEILDEKKYDL